MHIGITIHAIGDGSVTSGVHVLHMSSSVDGTILSQSVAHLCLVCRWLYMCRLNCSHRSSYMWVERAAALTLKTKQTIIFEGNKNNQQIHSNGKETKKKNWANKYRKSVDFFCTRGNTVCVLRAGQSHGEIESEIERQRLCVWNALHLSKKQLVTLAVHSVETVRMRNTVEKCEQWSDDNYMHRNFNMSPCVILFFIWFRRIQHFCCLFCCSD